MPPQAENYAENESHNARHIPSGEEIERDEKDFDHDQWCFIPYAFQGDQRATKFEDFLNKNGISSDLQHIILDSDFWNESDQFKKVRKAYEEISSKDINRTTMTVFSGSKSKDLTNITMRICVTGLQMGVLICTIPPDVYIQATTVPRINVNGKHCD